MIFIPFFLGIWYNDLYNHLQKEFYYAPATDKKEISVLDKLMALLQPVAQKLGLTTITSESRHASPLKKRLETKKKKDNTPSYVPERLRIIQKTKMLLKQQIYKVIMKPFSIMRRLCLKESLS